jgi:Zn-finger nucleic acid-binding protein
MECPSCRKPLEQKSYRGGITVDECLWCHSVWFDKDELDAYRTAVEIQDRGADPPVFVKKEQSENRACPKCVSSSLVDGEVRHIMLSRCQQCYGYFVPYDQLLEIKDVRKPDYPVGLAILDAVRILSL